MKFVRRPFGGLINPIPKGVIPADKQDEDTLDVMKSEPFETVFLEPDPDSDVPLPNADGSISMVRIFGLNGISYPVKVGERTKVPRSVLKVIEAQQAALREKPVLQRYGTPIISGQHQYWGLPGQFTLRRFIWSLKTN